VLQSTPLRSTTGRAAPPRAAAGEKTSTLSPGRPDCRLGRCSRALPPPAPAAHAVAEARSHAERGPRPGSWCFWVSSDPRVSASRVLLRVSVGPLAFAVVLDEPDSLVRSGSPNAWSPPRASGSWEWARWSSGRGRHLPRRRSRNGFERVVRTRSAMDGGAGDRLLVACGSSLSAIAMPGLRLRSETAGPRYPT